MTKIKDDEPTKYSLVYYHDLLDGLVPSGKSPHIDAMEQNGLLDELTVEQAARVVILAQTAYRNGQASTGAERIDNDAIWINGVGGIEQQTDGTWKLTMPDIDTSKAAAALGSSTSQAKAAAARQNGRKGGRPRKTADNG